MQFSLEARVYVKKNTDKLEPKACSTPKDRPQKI